MVVAELVSGILNLGFSVNFGGLSFAATVGSLADAAVLGGVVLVGYKKVKAYLAKK